VRRLLLFVPLLCLASCASSRIVRGSFDEVWIAASAAARDHGHEHPDFHANEGFHHERGLIDLRSDRTWYDRDRLNVRVERDDPRRVRGREVSVAIRDEHLLHFILSIGFAGNRRYPDKEEAFLDAVEESLARARGEG